MISTLNNFEFQIDDFVIDTIDIINELNNDFNKDEIIIKMNNLSLKQRLLQIAIEGADDKENKEYQFLLQYFNTANNILNSLINTIIEENGK